jgi:nucleoside-diphosphate-sugar epimerase
MRFLILGGTRFIGPHIVGRLLRLGHEVAVFHRGETAAELPAAVRHITGDRRRLRNHVGDFAGFAPDVVIDMIGFTQRDAEDAVATFSGLAGRLVLISSGDVYRAFGVVSRFQSGPVEPVPLTEHAPLRDVFYLARQADSRPGDELYDYEKILVERTVLAQSALPATVLRLPMVYGPGDYQHRLYPYVRRMDDGRRLILLDEGLASWRSPRGYVEDVAVAIVLAATSPRAAGRIYNVSEPNSYTEAEWIYRIAEAIGWTGQVVRVPQWRLPVAIDTDQDVVMETSRIRAELAYREETPSKHALLRTIEWERVNPPAQSLDYSTDDALIAELGL